MPADRSSNGLTVLEGLTADQWSRLAPLFVRAGFRAGETIFAQGDPADVFYLVQAGRVAIRFHAEDGEWLTISTVESGGVCGWSAALSRPAYSASAVCLSDVLVLGVRGSRLQAVIRSEPELGKVLLERLASVVGERLTDAQALLASQIRREICRPPLGAGCRKPSRLPTPPPAPG